MAYTRIRTAAAVPIPGVTSLSVPLWTTSFPEEWMDPLRRLAAANNWRITGDTEEERRRFLRVRSLNTLLAALLPDLVSVGRWPSFDATRPWLYAHEPVSPDIVTDIVVAWVSALARTDDARRVLPSVLRSLSEHSLEWTRRDIDLLDARTSNAGTWVPASDAAFHLLPDLLARRVAEAEPYTFNSSQLRFVPVAGGFRGAELVSWPPLELRSKTGAVRGYYSAALTLSLRTVPFSPTPRIHIRTSVRRWIKDRVDVRRDRQASALVRSTNLDLDGSGRPSRFARLTLSSTHGYRWFRAEAATALDLLDVHGHVPSASDLGARAQPYLHGKDGFLAAVTHHTRMDTTHPVKVGVASAERRRIATWAMGALGAEFTASPAMHAHPIPRRRAPVKQLAKVPSATKDPEARKQALSANAARRREALTGNGRSDLHVVVLSSSDAGRDLIVEAARTLFAPNTIAAVLDGTSPRVIVCEGDVAITMHLAPLGDLGEALDLSQGTDPDTHRSRSVAEQHRAALRRRADQARLWLEKYVEQLGQEPAGLLVVLGGKDAFTPRTDPKHALRRGFALAGSGFLSQFLTPPGPDTKRNPADSSSSGESTTPKEAVEDPGSHRAQAAWVDLLRQTGTILHRTMPVRDDGTEAQQIAVHVVKRRAARASATGYSRAFTPTATRISTSGRVDVRLDQGSWMPYGRALIQLARRTATDEAQEPDAYGPTQTETTAEAVPYLSDQRKAEMFSSFLGTVLQESRYQDTVLLAVAQKVRSAWPWLLDGQVDPSAPQIAPGRNLSPRLNPKLRILRIRTHDGDETPEWWAEDGDRVGVGKGLWAEACEGESDGCRVYFSTAEKPPTMKTAQGVTKFTPGLNQETGQLTPPATSFHYGAPQLLEIIVLKEADGDTPDALASFVHMQRFTEDTPSGLRLPLVLHLAQLMEEYGLADEEAAEADEEATDATDDDAA